MNFGNRTPNSTPARPKLSRSRFSGAGKYEDKSSRIQRLSQGKANSVLSPQSADRDGRKRIKVEIDNRTNEYKFNVNFYSIPPFGRVQLHEAEEWVKERFSILRMISDLRADASVMRQNTQYIRVLDERLKSINNGNNFLVEGIGGVSNTKVQEARRRDHVSHFLLRLYCCRNEEMRKWFIQNETELLRFRLFDESNNVNLAQFLEYNNLVYETADENFKNHLIKLNILNSAALRKSNNQLYRIPFEQALDMVRTRRVYLEGGYCYVLTTEMISIICMRFKLELSQSLASLSSYLPHLEEDNRLLPRLEALYNETVKSSRQQKHVENRNGLDQISPDMIDELASEFFPPCMRNIHDNLRINHHLRHVGRLHYSLFLKSIGLRMEDALQFFRDEFIQKVTPERFQREYAYNIRYNYGKEGKRVSMSAYSCAKIMNENAPGPGDSHGCPFKHFDQANLVRMLRKHQIGEEDINSMVDLVKERSYTFACTKYFSCKNPGYILSDRGIYHPSQFFVEARKAAQGLPSEHVLTVQPNATQEVQDQEIDDFDDEIDDQMFSELTEEDMSMLLNSEDCNNRLSPSNATIKSEPIEQESFDTSAAQEKDQPNEAETTLVESHGAIFSMEEKNNSKEETVQSEFTISNNNDQPARTVAELKLNFSEKIDQSELKLKEQNEIIEEITQPEPNVSQPGTNVPEENEEKILDLPKDDNFKTEVKIEE